MASRFSKEEREGPGTAIQVRVCQRRRNALRLAGAQIELVYPPAENDCCVVRVGSNVVVFAPGGDFTELAEIDAVDVVSAARTPCSPRVLLCAVAQIRKPIVRDDVVELARGLVVPGAPGQTAIECHQGALINAENAPLRLGRVDPQRMIVVAARRA